MVTAELLAALDNLVAQGGPRVWDYQVVLDAPTDPRWQPLEEVSPDHDQRKVYLRGP